MTSHDYPDPHLRLFQGPEDSKKYESYALSMLVILLLQLPMVGIIHHLNNCCANRNGHLDNILQMAIVFLSLAFGLEICASLKP